MANPAKDEFDRGQHRSVTLLMAVLFLLLGVILFSGNITPRYAAQVPQPPGRLHPKWSQKSGKDTMPEPNPESRPSARTHSKRDPADPEKDLPDGEVQPRLRQSAQLLVATICRPSAPRAGERGDERHCSKSIARPRTTPRPRRNNSRKTFSPRAFTATRPKRSEAWPSAARPPLRRRF